MADRQEILELDQFFPYRVTAVAARVSKGLSEVYRDRGIKTSEWRVLAHLAGSTGVSVREIHEQANLDKAKISRAVERLDALGYVRKRPHPDDGRLLVLTLTSKGRALYGDIVPRAREFEARLLSALSEAEQRTLRRVLGKLLDPGAPS